MIRLLIQFNTNKKERIVEKWSDMISGLNIDITKSINYVTANQIKEITNKEPRIMAKMDRIECLPKIFKQNGLFLLPISRSEYAIVKGDGHHNPEQFEQNRKFIGHPKPFRLLPLVSKGRAFF